MKRGLVESPEMGLTGADARSSPFIPLPLTAMRSTRILLATTLAAFAVACGSSGISGTSNNPGGAPPMTAAVNATSLNTFTPANVAIGVGGTVTFTFGDVAHNVFFDNSPAGAPDAITGANANMTAARTFTTAGTFEFDCHIHPGMKGTVLVSNTSSAPPPGGGMGY
jgi:plastocyanin